METPTPPNYANYPRTNTGADVARLRHLLDGYFGLNKVFLINVLFIVALRVVQVGAAASGSEGGILVVFLLGYLVMAVAIGFVSYKHNQSAGEGLGWQPSGALIASVLMGLNSFLCCGAIGYGIVQSKIAKVLKEYGIAGGFFGVKKAHAYHVLAQLENIPQSAPPPPSSFNL